MQHPYDSSMLIDWMLETWLAIPNETLVIITFPEDGLNTINRLRVKLSIARKALKVQHVTAIRRFGIRTSVIPWTMEDGTQLEAVIMNQLIERRHVMQTALSQFDLSF